MFEDFGHHSAIAVILVLLIGSQTIADDETIKFFSDYNTAIKEAKASGRPIFLEFRCSP